MSTKSSFSLRKGRGRVTPAVRAEFGDFFGDRALFNVPLGPLLAYAVGGPADVLVYPSSVEELHWLARTCERHDLAVTTIGSGTNLLVLDGGIRGVVLRLGGEFNSIQRLEDTPQGHARVRCGAGVEKPRLLDWAVGQGLGGVEFSSGVPGTLGGGIFMNAGTKYGCYADILVELSTFSFTEGVRTFPRADLYFGYREQTAVESSLAISMVFELKPAARDVLMAEVRRILYERGEKQPLDFPSCGSTFKNPPQGLSAGRLVERAGLKGTRVGGAEISLKHANFILNKDRAKAKDILALIDIIKRTVLERFNVPLECEVILLGEPDHASTKQVQNSD